MGRVASRSKVIMRCYGACRLNKQGDNDKNEVLWGVASTSKVQMIKMRC